MLPAVFSFPTGTVKCLPINKQTSQNFPPGDLPDIFVDENPLPPANFLKSTFLSQSLFDLI